MPEVVVAARPAGYQLMLAGPVRTEESEDRASVDREINAVRRDGITESFDQAFGDY